MIQRSQSTKCYLLVICFTLHLLLTNVHLYVKEDLTFFTSGVF